MNYWVKLKARHKLIKAFRYAGVYKTVGTDNRKIFPKIHKLDLTTHSEEYVFSLPSGLDPQILKKNFFAFQQVFGTSISLEGEVKTFVLKVFSHSLPSELTYNFETFDSLIEFMRLPIVAGMDLNGDWITFDLVKYPHILIAGETGSGKSTQLRSVLSTIIQALSPKRLELYLCDLKRSEFHIFRHIEHVRGLFVTPKEMEPMLNHIQKQMQERGDLLDQHEEIHIDDLPPALRPPYIVLCIDEVALLQKENAIMELVEEISAIGRALGVFLILSMQRPDRKVLDGKLKNNLTVRMGFKCADLINSRIIGTPGSEKLKEPGRMFLKLPAYSDLKEIQAPYLGTNEAKKLLKEYRCANPKKSKMKHSDASVIDLKEVEENVFGVLDE
ncbi:cell division protein FtsK [Neobacillus notoginsengisoli]|uniref:Cell division protein FtsK n=1 Tax=Neobacillus notoginsengisoli TaxID=1578198 RepID=A0A417YFF7_9BACI|nr:FtsK/SpoIIIE domain-containing protein [Neobacillus notoginsengisoli]RHW31499.1 cell division protein FtsK [Neobacillus notoginsengisoli]